MSNGVTENAALENAGVRRLESRNAVLCFIENLYSPEYTVG